MFHEMGHTVFYWLFGHPAIPSIMTIFGADKAGGYTMEFGHSQLVQLLAIAGLAYGCYRLHLIHAALLFPAVVFSITIAAIGFTRYSPLVISYMGHGSAIVCGGVLLYRAWLNIVVRTRFERWCNALFGFFIVLNNADFARKIVFSPDFRAEYQEAELTMDFVAMTEMMPFWRVEGIAVFTLGLCAATIILSWALAVYFFEDIHYNDSDA